MISKSKDPQNSLNQSKKSQAFNMHEGGAHIFIGHCQDREDTKPDGLVLVLASSTIVFTSQLNYRVSVFLFIEINIF